MACLFYAFWGLDSDLQACVRSSSPSELSLQQPNFILLTKRVFLPFIEVKCVDLRKLEESRNKIKSTHVLWSSFCNLNATHIFKLVMSC